MKVTIWPQFSSNHSSMFWVVGTFATTQNAENARQKMLELFAESFHILPDADWETLPLSEFVDDPEEMDLPFDETITRIANILIAQSHDQTWMQRTPFMRMFSHFGAAPVMGIDEFSAVEELQGFNPVCELQFIAPDDTTADQLEARLRITSSDALPPENPEIPFNRTVFDVEIIKRDGRQFALKFQRYGAGGEIEALVAYLEAYRCEGIKLAYTQGSPSANEDKIDS